MGQCEIYVWIIKRLGWDGWFEAVVAGGCLHNKDGGISNNGGGWFINGGGDDIPLPTMVTQCHPP